VRIKSVGIENFRCLNAVEVDFGEITTFIGPNGAGKSSVLRALNWFFNGGQLDRRDVWSGSTQERIRVRVTFDGLTATDRQALGEKYAPKSAETFTAWRTWTPAEDKMTGNALVFPPFEIVRQAASAGDKKTAWSKILGDFSDLGLPNWSSAPKIEAEMDQWERDNASRLEESESGGSHLFGFNGQNVLSGIFDFVLVTADLRAQEESTDSRGTIISRILEKTVDRSKADAAFSDLAKEVSEKRNAITTQHLTTQLQGLADELSKEIEAFTTGRKIRLKPEEPELKPQASKIHVSVVDQLTETDVDRQGHGFQRALLISSLKLLADRGTAGTPESVIYLAIEEPELFQHPTQARAFSSVLRSLAADPENGLQISYATHSPYFIDARYFDQVRRVRRNAADSDSHAEVTITQATVPAVVKRLEGYVDPAVITARWDLVCTQHLSEALFADAVLLVEGDDDKAVFEGIAARTRHLAIDGISVAAAQGKGHLYVPNAILSELGIPTVTVFDNDSGCAERMEAKNKSAKDIQNAVRQHKRDNRQLLRYFGIDPIDYPLGRVSQNVLAVSDTLETIISEDWPVWDKHLQETIASGQGVGNKNAATYALVSEQCTVDPSGRLLDPVLAVRSLLTHSDPAVVQ
jgi:putative ATP-dependent endonuclease of OLD family